MRTVFLALFFSTITCNLLIAQGTSNNFNLPDDINSTILGVFNIIGIFITLFFKRPRVLISAVIAINLLSFHSAIISSFPDEESAEIIGSLIAFICLMCFIFYFIDQNREKSEKEYFRGKNIFHRYGKGLLSLAVPIGHSNDDDSLNRVISLRDGFYQPLEERIKKEYENFYPFEIRILGRALKVRIRKIENL